MVIEKTPDFANLTFNCSNLMEEMFEDTSMTIYAIVVYIFNMPVGSVLWFLVIHYERFGGDPMKRSISNKLLSSAALVKLLGGFVIENIFLVGTFFRLFTSFHWNFFCLCQKYQNICHDHFSDDLHGLQMLFDLFLFIRFKIER